MSIAVSIYVKIGDKAIDELEENKEIITLSKAFWGTLYGYVTLLNLIFTTIAYNFIKVSSYLQHKEIPKLSSYLLKLFWVLQAITILLNIYLI